MIMRIVLNTLIAAAFSSFAVQAEAANYRDRSVSMAVQAGLDLKKYLG